MRAIEKRRLIRPYTGGEAVDAGLRIFRTIAWPTLKATFAPMILAGAAILFIWTFLVPIIFTTQAEATLQQQLGESAFAYLAFFFIALPLIIISLSTASVPVIRMASQAILGETVSLKEVEKDMGKGLKFLIGAVWRCVARAFWLPLGTLALMAISALIAGAAAGAEVKALSGYVAVLGGGLSLLVVPSLMRAVAIAPAVALLEGKNSAEAVERAKFLSQPHQRDGTVGGTVLQTFFTLLIFYFVISSGLSTVISATGLPQFLADWVQRGASRAMLSSFLTAVPFVLILWLIAPIWSTTMTVLYYDRRVRHEGLDIEVLAKDVLHADRQTALLN